MENEADLQFKDDFFRTMCMVAFSLTCSQKRIDASSLIDDICRQLIEVRNQQMAADPTAAFLAQVFDVKISSIEAEYRKAAAEIKDAVVRMNENLKDNEDSENA